MPRASWGFVLGDHEVSIPEPVECAENHWLLSHRPIQEKSDHEDPIGSGLGGVPVVQGRETVRPRKVLWGKLAPIKGMVTEGSHTCSSELEGVVDVLDDAYEPQEAILPHEVMRRKSADVVKFVHDYSPTGRIDVA